MRGDERMKSGAAASGFQRARPPRRIGRCGALLPLFRLVGVPCIAALSGGGSPPTHRRHPPLLPSTRPAPSPGPFRAREEAPRIRLRCGGSVHRLEGAIHCAGFAPVFSPTAFDRLLVGSLAAAIELGEESNVYD